LNSLIGTEHTRHPHEVPVQKQILVFTSYGAVMVWLHFHNYKPHKYHAPKLVCYINSDDRHMTRREKFAIILISDRGISDWVKEKYAMEKSRYSSIKAVGVVFAILLVIAIQVVYAAPMPPRILVNHKTQQCARITPGDECGDVIFPADWEYQDASLGEKCPDNYTLVDLHLKWKAFKSQLCCSEGHSGAAGDCQDVITQKSKRQCAFVDDIQQCTSLPEGWKAWGQNCPIDFYWTKDVVCSAVSPTMNATAGVPSVPTATIQPTTPPAADQTQPGGSTSARNPLFPCASSGLALLVLFSLRRRHI